MVCSICRAGTTTPAKTAATAPKTAASSAADEKQLEKLCRALKQPNPSSAYAQLSVFAMQKSLGVLRMRAALALGYYDYGKGNYTQAGVWFARAKNDPVLAEYALYWIAETDLALGRSEDAAGELTQFRAKFPNSVITEQALQSLGVAAMAATRPADAVAALDAYTSTSQRPALLFLRAEAREQAGQPKDAAADYEAVYMRFATSEQGREAALKLDFLRSSLGANFPALSLDQRLAHAAILFNAKDWSEARNEYAALLGELSGPERERAQLRILECGAEQGAGPAEIAALSLTDPDVDAERFQSLADLYRGEKQEASMVAAVESAASRGPSSNWAEAALFMAGNYYWVQLDRDRAVSYYKRVAEGFPKSPDADSAQWRVAWTAVLERKPEAAEFLQEHLRLFPGSSYTPDALYWLGRLAEDAGVAPLARSYYEKLAQRYPQNYFEIQGAARLRAIGPGDLQTSDVIALIPPVSAVPKLDGPIPAAAAEPQARATALESIAFDSSAELELRAGYAATGEPKLLLEAAQAAAAAGHYGAAIVTVHQIFPQLESQTFSDVPRDVWLVAYPLPFEASIRRWSANAGLDPMLVAGLIRQESAFDPEARSGKNAMGLMQLISQTAGRLARSEKVRYSRARLSDPDYNVRLGTVYFAGLEKQFGGPEQALAAYNAGEDRVELWTDGQNYSETAAFVDSIPFTETRQYVQIITRNADIYRRLYGAKNESPTARTGHGN